MLKDVRYHILHKRGAACQVLLKFVTGIDTANFYSAINICKTLAQQCITREGGR